MKPFSALALTAVLTLPALGQDPPKPRPATPPAAPLPRAGTPDALPPSVAAEDVKGVTAAVEAFVKAFNAGDSKAVSALFTESAEVTDEEGGTAVGRPAITHQFEEAFKDHPGRKITLFTDSIKFFADDVAQEEGHTLLTPVGDGPAEHSRYTVVYVKKDGKWLQASIRDDHDHSLSPHEHLKPLAWIVGEWVNETGGLKTTYDCHWTPDKNYLIRDFTVSHEGKPEMSGTQRIGWDPLTKHIKSWVFDSEGGYGDALWTEDSGHWVVKANGVLPDGKTASATYHIAREGKDKVSWQSVDRIVGGKPVVEVEEMILVRRPPPAQAPPAGTPPRPASR